MKRNLDEAEAEMKKICEQEGLIMEISHEKYENPIEYDFREMFCPSASAVTTVNLFDKEEINTSDRDDTVKALAFGIAVCASGDQFNKKKGRVITGFRALKQYMNNVE